MIRAFAALLLLALLGACASLSETQCQNGDWYGIGMRDGSNGKLLSYFDQHVKACSRYGITPQRTPWQKGRAEGLKLYCTPSNAYQLGRRGSRPAPVCSPAQAADMALPNEFGMNYYNIGQEIERLRSDIRDIDSQILLIGDTNPELRAHLLAERAHKWFRINTLEARQLRYATWP